MDDAPFKDRILAVYEASGGGVVLRDASLQEIAGRTFLVGTCADTGRNEDWTAGKTAAVAWDSVVSVIPLTEDEYRGMRGKKFKRR